MKPVPTPGIEVARLELWIARTQCAYGKAKAKPRRTELSNLLCDAAQSLSRLRAAIFVSLNRP